MFINYGVNIVDESHNLLTSTVPSVATVASGSILSHSETRLIMTVPSHSDLVSITGALIVFSFISSCVILTYIINGFNLLWDKMVHGELVPDSKSLFSSLITFSLGLSFYLINEISMLYINLKTGLTSWIRWKSKSSKWRWDGRISSSSILKKRV